jgi:hypothetical protein
MSEELQIASASLRLLECWLPLVQELNMLQEWGDQAAALEALIQAAAPALQHSSSVGSARAILILYHMLGAQG